MKIGLVGIGATGSEIGHRLLGRAAVSIVAIVDRDPGKLGQSARACLRSEAAPDLIVEEDLGALIAAGPDLAIVTVGSTLSTATPVLDRIASAGINAISLCEELSFPWRSHPAESAALDRVARENGVSILGTGCNPGFVMDTLPILLSSALESVDRIEIERTADLSRFGPLLSKFGFGLTPEEYRSRAGRTVVGHIGFVQSVSHLAHRLGWELDDIQVDDPAPFIVSDQPRDGKYVAIPAGTVAAVAQTARGLRAGRSVLECRERFGFFVPADGVAPSDAWRLTGGGREIRLVAETGFDSWETTIAELLNLIRPVIDAPPGLLATSDLPVAAFAAKGAPIGVPAA